jgi:hypothetical protein
VSSAARRARHGAPVAPAVFPTGQQLLVRSVENGWASVTVNLGTKNVTRRLDTESSSLFIFLQLQVAAARSYVAVDEFIPSIDPVHCSRCKALTHPAAPQQLNWSTMQLQGRPLLSSQMDVLGRNMLMARHSRVTVLDASSHKPNSSTSLSDLFSGCSHTLPI